MSPHFAQGRSNPRSGGSEERGEKQISQRKARVKKEIQSGVDTQGKWLKKSGKLYHGDNKDIGVG
ncbi:MAG: hypothetical protein ACMUEL_04625 [Flavobacteriales bacterium Tduv]